MNVGKIRIHQGLLGQFQMKFNSKAIVIISFIFTFSIKLVKADDDDDDDILLDFVLGVAWGLCDASSSCAPILPWIALISLVVLGLIYCFGNDEDIIPIYRCPSGKSVLVGGGGYCVGRILRS